MESDLEQVMQETMSTATPVAWWEHGFELVVAGGPVVALLVLMSVAALTIVFLRLLQFHQMKIGDRQVGREALRLCLMGSPQRAIECAERSPNPVAGAIALVLAGRVRGIADATVREEVLRYGNNVLEGLRTWFRPLEVIGSLAPLLGLFGTVLGMIEAFRQLEQAGSQVNPAILSGGIWEALLTTAVGLAVAIPAVTAQNYLDRRVERLAHEMEDSVTRIFTADLSPHPNPAKQETRHHAPARLRSAPVPAGR